MEAGSRQLQWADRRTSSGLGSGWSSGEGAQIQASSQYDPVDVGNLISGSSAFSKSSLNIWKFTIHILLKPGLENFEHYFASM